MDRETSDGSRTRWPPAQQWGINMATAPDKSGEVHACSTPPWLSALRISALSLAALVVLYTMAWAVSQIRRQGIADDPSRIASVLPGMTVQQVRNALGCPHATDIPSSWHPRHQGFAAEALADIRGKRQLLY